MASPVDNKPLGGFADETAAVFHVRLLSLAIMCSSNLVSNLTTGERRARLCIQSFDDSGLFCPCLHAGKAFVCGRIIWGLIQYRKLK